MKDSHVRSTSQMQKCVSASLDTPSGTNIGESPSANKFSKVLKFEAAQSFCADVRTLYFSVNLFQLNLAGLKMTSKPVILDRIMF